LGSILTGPLALVWREDLGIAPERQKLCHHLVQLPMLGQVGSLNVSVAAGIAIYEAVRQRL
jgi:rRNA methylases